MRVCAMTTLLLVLIMPAPTFGKCVSGQPIDYNDVGAVLITTRYRALDGYLSGYGTAENTTVEGSRFWALFWNLDVAEPEHPTRYSQFSIPDSIGTYELSTSLKDAIAILRQDRFFELAPKQNHTTDQTYSACKTRNDGSNPPASSASRAFDSKHAKKSEPSKSHRVLPSRNGRVRPLFTENEVPKIDLGRR